MSRFLISTMPALGHINAALPIARKLIEHGHTVWWYTGPEFEAKVEATGAHFTPFKAASGMGDEELDRAFPDRHKLKGLAQLKFAIKHVFIDSAPGQMRDISEILKVYPADVILSDMTAAGAGWLHQKGGPVWAAYGHLPLTLSSQDCAPFGLAILPSTSWAGRLRNRVLNLLLKKVIFRDVIAYTDRKRQSVGLSPEGKSPTDTAISPFLYLQGTVAEFEYPRSDLPPQVHFVGPFLPPPPTNWTPPAWWNDLSSGRPVVHVTQGTVATEARELILPTIEALAQEDVLLIVTTGGQPIQSLGLNELPSNVRLEEFIPHHYLLPYVALMITNGGYNGVQIALANGVPLVVAGASEDKPEVANRVAWSGTGINLKTHTPSPAQIRTAVKQILNEASYRETARHFEAEFARHNAAEEAVQLLERLARTKTPIVRTEVAELPGNFSITNS